MIPHYCEYVINPTKTSKVHKFTLNFFIKKTTVRTETLNSSNLSIAISKSLLNKTRKGDWDKTTNEQ